MEASPAKREKRIAQLTQRRGMTTKVAILFEDRLEIQTRTFLGEVRSALELDSIEGISHVRGANVPLTVAAFSTLVAFLATGASVLASGASPADLRTLFILGSLGAVLALLFLIVREDTFRLETFRKGRFTLFADHDPDTAVFEFLGAVRRARQRFLLGRREAVAGHSVADEIRKLAALAAESVLTPGEFELKKRELLELEGVRRYEPEPAEESEEEDSRALDQEPRSIN